MDAQMPIIDPATAASIARLLVCGQNAALLEKIMSPGRSNARVARARQTAVYIAHKLGPSHVELARAFRRAPSAISRAVQTTAQRLEADTNFRWAVDALIAQAQRQAALELAAPVRQAP